MENKLKKPKAGLGHNHHLIKEYKNSLSSLNTIKWEASIGLLLGDRSLRTTNKKKTHLLQCEWSDKYKEYIDHVHSLFDEWILSPPHKKN